VALRHADGHVDGLLRRRRLEQHVHGCPCSTAWGFGDEPHTVEMLLGPRVSRTVGRHYRRAAMYNPELGVL
jgi:hypothetical protein